MVRKLFSHSGEEWYAVLYLYVVMLVAGILFSNPATIAFNYQKFLIGGGVPLDNVAFSFLCFIGSICVPLVLLLRTRSKYIRRTWYVACSLPFVSFVFPYGVWYIVGGIYTVNDLLYIAIFFSTVLIAGSTFRTLD